VDTENYYAEEAGSRVDWAMHRWHRRLLWQSADRGVAPYKSIRRMQVR